MIRSLDWEEVIPRSFLVGTEDMVVSPGELGSPMSRRLEEFRLVGMPRRHEAIFTNPIGVADKVIKAGCD